MSGNITGIVQEVNNNGMGKGSNIMVDGRKFGCYDPIKTGIDVVSVGDEVSFAWATKGQYTNIMGRVNKTGNTGTPTATPAPASGGGNKGGGQSGDFVFPIPALNYQRSVVRRDAIHSAVALFVSTEADAGMDAVQAAERVVTIARVFEEYEAGDLDEKEAADAVAALSAVNE